MYGMRIEVEPFYLVTEYLENGDLKHFLLNEYRKPDEKKETSFETLIRISENVRRTKAVCVAANFVIIRTKYDKKCK